MYRIMYRKDGETDWQCIGSYAEFNIALEEMDKLQSGVLGETGDFELIKSECDFTEKERSIC